MTLHPTSIPVAPADIEELRELNQVLEEKVVERTHLLMRAKKTWEATFDAIVDPLAIIDDEMRIVRTNLAHARCGSRDVRTGVGSHCYAVLFGGDRPCRGCPAIHTFATGEGADGEVEDSSRERVYRVWSHRMQTAQTADAGSEQVVCHYKDITDEKALHHQLLQSEKMAAVGTLAGGVAHEINNPLGAIMAFAQLALQDAEPGTTIHDFLSEIERNTHRCKRIVGSLLDFSRPSRGERRPVDLAEVCNQAVFLVKTQYKRFPVRVVTDFGDEPPKVMGDRNQLQQVLVNLVANAFQAMETRAGELRLAIRADEGRSVILSVSDQGEGIQERYLAKIFDPFFTTKPEGKGTGLGLSISYSIIQEHDATVQVESVPGQGTEFVLTFPWPTDGGNP